jgi:DNA repair exonuclease SbcCD ATPase subunit
MKFATFSLLLATVVCSSNAAEVTPIEKVLEMLQDLETKIISEGKDAQKVYDEFSEFCEDRSRELGFAIKDGKITVKDLEAEITKESATMESLTAKIEELSGAIATDEADLKAATEIRAKEKVVFTKEEKELMEVINTLERAIGILEKEMGGASLMQMKSATSMVEALAVMVQATSLSTADAQKLSSFLQSQDQSDEDEPGAPAAAVFKNQSGGIIETMQDLLEKAESQLDELRKKETKNIQAYEMLASSLKDSIKYATKDMDKAKKGLEEASEAKAVAEGDLAVTSKDLKADIESLATLHSDCMKGAEDFESDTKARGEELKALATAKKVIEETTSGAAEQTYSMAQMSFMQVTTGAQLTNFEAVRFVRDLAHQHKSSALAQLATQMAQAMRSSDRNSADPFGKVKGLISDMIEKLEAEAEADATEKAYCDKEMAETEEKQSDKEALIEKLTTEIDSMSAKSAKLKEEVATLQKELAELASTQAKMDKVRAEEKAAFEVNSAEMKKGVDGVKLALKVLREYYSKDAKEDEEYKSAEGAGAGIIGLLEVCESDFSKGLAEMIATEESAAAEYVQLTKENEIEKAAKDQDVKYKTQEYKALDKAIAETTSDKATAEEELEAINEYYAGIKERCIAKPEPYEERVKRRDAEIAGLKQALSILDGEAVLIQQSSRKRTLRGRA